MKVCGFAGPMFAAVVCAGIALPSHGAKAAMNHRPLESKKAPSPSASSAVTRGKYLVTFGSCTDCHTPGSFFGKPDMTRFLGGSDVGFAIPGLGVFVGPNLTPDKQTGLGNWTAEQIVTALTTGKTPEGRTLAPVMPWHAYADLTKADALAVAAYLKSLPPVSHQVGGPYGPSQTPAEAVMVVIPPDVYSRLPKPGGATPAAAPASAPSSPPAAAPALAPPSPSVAAPAPAQPSPPAATLAPEPPMPSAAAPTPAPPMPSAVAPAPEPPTPPGK